MTPREERKNASRKPVCTEYVFVDGLEFLLDLFRHSDLLQCQGHIPRTFQRRLASIGNRRQRRPLLECWPACEKEFQTLHDAAQSRLRGDEPPENWIVVVANQPCELRRKSFAYLHRKRGPRLVV